MDMTGTRELVFEEEWRQREPLTPPDCDLRDLDGFMLNVERLLASELWALSTPAEFKAAFALWCRAWKQVPAASLPDDDLTLAGFSGASRRWSEVRAMALRGFVKCKDGRLYQRTLSEDAVRAWEKKREYRERTQAATEARKSKRRARTSCLKLAGSEANFRQGVGAVESQPPGAANIENPNHINGGAQRNDERDDSRDVVENSNVTTTQGQGQVQEPHNPLIVTLPKKANGAAQPPPTAWSEFAAIYKPPRTRSVVKGMVAFQDACLAHSPAVVLAAARRYAKESADPEFRVAPEKFISDLLPGFLDDAKKEVAWQAGRELTKREIETAWGQYAEPLFANVTKDLAVTFFAGVRLEIIPDAGCEIHFENAFRRDTAQSKFRGQLERFLPNPVVFLAPKENMP